MTDFCFTREMSLWLVNSTKISPPCKCVEYGKFFVQKVFYIRNRLGNIHSSCEHEMSISDVAPSVQYICEFDKLTENEVKSKIQQSSLRSCLFDPMPSWLVNQCDVLLLVLTTLINTSFQSGEFPKAWKEALVLPLLKKPGLDCQILN